MAHLGNTLINGALRVLGGANINSLNGSSVPANPVFTDTYDRLKFYPSILVDANVAAGDVIVGINGAYHPLKLGTAFNTIYPILYATQAISSGGTNNQTYVFSASFPVSNVQSMTLENRKPIYIKGTLNGNVFTPIGTAPLTQTAPTSEDGHQYILLGYATNSTTNMVLTSDHRIFQYTNGAFRDYSCAYIDDTVTQALTNSY